MTHNHKKLQLFIHSVKVIGVVGLLCIVSVQLYLAIDQQAFVSSQR